MKLKLIHFLSFRGKDLLLRVMRTFIFLFCATMFSFTPNDVASQNVEISIDEDKLVTVDEVFKIIRQQSNTYMFIYPENLFNSFPKIQLKKGRIEIDKLLNMALSGGNVNVSITRNNTILIKEKTAKEKQQQQVSGKVIDADGLPIPGVNIIIKGTKVGAATDFNGNYTIQVPGNNAILIFSSIGYMTQEVAVNDQTIINVTLKQDVNELEEVIISTGIFKRNAESYTGATVTIKKEDLKRVGNANLFQTIRNIDPSIAIFDNLELGSNPNALPEIQIRGASTIPSEDTELTGNLKGNYLKNPNQPLFILNGFESSVEQILDLDLNFIENVTILKDAASKAIYGSRAANGVVVIETQALGASEARITYNGSIDIQLPDLSSYDLTNALEKIEAERIDGMYIPSLNDADEYVRLQQLYNYRQKLALEGLDTDWMAKPLQTGVGQRHSISAELGADDLRMIGSFSYNTIEGVMKGSGRDIINGNLNTFYRVKNLSFTNRMTITSTNAYESPYGTFGEYAQMNPYWRAENADGSIPYYAEVVDENTKYTNPLYNATLNTKDEASYLNFINNFYLEWRIRPTLRATTRIGIDIKRNDADKFLPSEHTSFESYQFGDALLRKGSYQINNGKSSRLSGDFNLMFNKKINKSTYFANVGFNVNESKYEEIIHLAEGFPSGRDNIIFARDYALGTRPTGVEGVSREIGFLAVGSYVYDDRFLSDVTLRTNASSQFGKDNRWANFWSLGLGWNIHNEAFLKNSKVVDQLKLRGSVGSTGNQNFNSNASVSTYSYYLDALYQGFNGSYLDRLANEGLQWESKFDYNLGLDAKIKGLSLRFDYYESITENLITDITVPSSTGFNSVKENLGKVRNAGIELYASYVAWSSNQGFVAFNFGLQTNKNEIIELSDALQSYNDAAKLRAADRGNNDPVLIFEDGNSLNAIWAVPSLGIDPATGDEIYVDRNGNTTFEWNADDMIVAGNSNPEYRGTFGVNAEYKGFGIGVTGRYLGGGQLYNQTLVDRVENVDMNYNVDRRVLTGRWLVPGQIALYKRLGDYNQRIEGTSSFRSLPEKTRATTRFVQDRNELDIAAINVYYDFNDQMLDYLGIERLRLGFNMNEVAKFSTIKIERGTDFPFSRTLSFSLSATF